VNEIFDGVILEVGIWLVEIGSSSWWEDIGNWRDNAVATFPPNF
jgi:hypothetical protein